jgi:ATP-binding cassette subfamily F protein 3
LIDALATQIWEVDPDENHMVIFKGTYSEMKEERIKEAERLATATSASQSTTPVKRKAQSASTKEERRKLAQVQQLENKIAELEATLANLGAQLESPSVKPNEVAVLGKEYERVQKEMDAKLAEWETLS